MNSDISGRMARMFVTGQRGLVGSAILRAIEANESISGIFNVASGNYTVGEVADLVRACLKENLNLDIDLNILHRTDYRNYKVSIDKARNTLSFKPRHDIYAIVNDLIENRASFEDLDNPEYSNIFNC